MEAVDTVYVALRRSKSESITYRRPDQPTDGRTDTGSYKVVSSKNDSENENVKKKTIVKIEIKNENGPKTRGTPGKMSPWQHHVF